MSKRWIRRARGGPPEGWISKTTSDEPGDGILAPESGPRAHTCRRLEHKPSKKSGAWRRVHDCFPTGFPPMCRSASCALKSKVSGRRRAGRKKSPEARRFDGSGSGGGRGFWKENKVIGRKHSHQKKKIWVSPLALIPCEKRK